MTRPLVEADITDCCRFSLMCPFEAVFLHIAHRFHGKTDSESNDCQNISSLVESGLRILVHIWRVEESDWQAHYPDLLLC